MKKLTRQWLIAISVLYLHGLTAQNKSCDFVPPSTNNAARVAEGGASTCGDILKYIPGYLTDVSCSKTLTINISVFVMCHGNDTMKDPFSLKAITAAGMTHWVNTFYNPHLASLPAPRVPNPNPTLEQSDTRIRLRIKDLYYVQAPVDNYTNHTNGNTFVESKINQIWPNGNVNSVIMFIGNSVPSTGIVANGIMSSDGAAKYFTIYGDSWKAYLGEGTVLHEMGHALGLYHTFTNSTTYVDGDGVNDTPPDKMYCSPAATCPNNLMSYVEDGWYLSPKQIAIMRMNLENNLWDSGANGSPVLNSYTQVLANCKKTAGASAYQITSTQTWDKAVVLDNDLIIKTGNTLTVKCKVSMPEDGKIVVEPGARLIVDEGFITNSCGDLWTGIEVQGIAAATQALSAGVYQQGYVELKNNARIENAWTGVTCNNGGILWATSSVFRNNVKAVHFASYTNKSPAGAVIANISRFEYCQFYTTRNLNESQAFNSFITATGVWLSRFKGNLFENTRTDITGASGPLGTGIYSYNSKLAINSACVSMILPCPEADIIFNEFRNLNVGIRISDPDGGQINQNKFLNCSYGILSESSYNLRISNNRIWVGACPSGIIEPEYGIMLNGDVFGLDVTGNQIYKSANSNAASTTGIAARSTGANNNTITKNTLTDLDYGNLSLNTNRSFLDNNTGVLYTCNYNYNTVEDFYLTWDAGGSYSSSGIRYYQGSLSSSAANYFTNDGPGETDFHNVTYNPIYYYWDNSIKKKPLYYTPTRVVLHSVAATPVLCFGDIRVPISLKSGLASYEELQQLHASLSGSATQRMTSGIDILSMLDEKQLAIDPSVRDLFAMSNDKLSGLEILEQVIAETKLRNDLMIRDSVQALNETGMHHKDLIYALNTGLNQPSVDMNKAWELITREGKPGEAGKLLAAIPQKYQLEEYQKTDWERFSRFAILTENWIVGGRFPSALNQDEVVQLKQEAEAEDGKSSLIARNLMNIYYDGHYMPEVNFNTGEYLGPKPENGIGQSKLVKVYPNPASREVTIAWEAYENDPVVYLTVFNSLGTQVAQQQTQGSHCRIDVSSMAPGVYTGHLVVGKNEIRTFRFMVMR